MSAPVESLARSLGADAWRLALVAGADPAASTRAALHALVIGAVRGGADAERPAVLALAWSWARSNPGSGGDRDEDGAVPSAFWALDEPLRSALWCTDRLALSTAELAQVTGSAAAAAAVARGRVRRAACRRWRATAAGSSCGGVADLMGRVTAGHASTRQAARVDKHVAGCADCSKLLSALGDPTAAVEAGLPAVPDLVEPARRAWRDHVGAPRLTPAESSSRLAASVTSHRRPLVALLAIATAGSFGAASNLLAASTEAADPPAVASPALRVPREPPPVALRPQAVLPPLADDVVVDPSLAHVVTRDLTQVAAPPAPTPSPPPPPATAAVTAPPAPSAPALIGEPPPAVAQPQLLDIGLPLPVLLPVDVEVGRNCARISIGPLRLALPCQG